MSAPGDGVSATLGTGSLSSCESDPGVENGRLAQELWLGREGTHVPRRAEPPQPNSTSSSLPIIHPGLTSEKFIQQIAELFGTRLRKKKKFQQWTQIQVNLSSLSCLFLQEGGKKDPDIFQEKINSQGLGRGLRVWIKILNSKRWLSSWQCASLPHPY